MVATYLSLRPSWVSVCWYSNLLNGGNQYGLVFLFWLGANILAPLTLVADLSSRLGKMYMVVIFDGMDMFVKNDI